MDTRVDDARRQNEDSVREARGLDAELRERRLEARLRFAQDRFRRLAEISADLVFTVDHDGIFTYANASSIRTFGWAPSDLVGKPFTDFLADERIAQDLATFADIVARGRTLADYVTVIRRKDGSAVRVLANSETFRGDGGEVLEVFGTIRPMSDETTTEAALRESRERFELLSNATNDAVWDWKVGEKNAWHSSGFARLFRFAPGEFGDDFASWRDRVHPRDRDRAERVLTDTLASKAPAWSHEYRFRRGDGTYAFVLDRAEIIRDADGRALRVLGRMTDLSEQHAANARIREQAELIEQASDAIIATDVEGNVRTWNSGAEAIFGWTREEILGRSAPEILRANVSRTQLVAALKEKGTWSGEVAVVAKGGRAVSIDLRLTLIQEGNVPMTALAIATDITARKQLEVQSLRSQRLESIGTLAGGIAHDLNNVLQPILLSSELLRMHVKEGPAREMIEALENSAKRGVDMVKQVLSFARGIEADRVVMNPFSVAREVVRIAQETFPRSISTEIHSPPDLWTIVGSPTQLNQILLNLALNSRDAMPDGGRLVIRLSNAVLDEVYAKMNPEGKPGPHVIIEVTDDGVGIPKEIQDRVFEPFFTTKEIGKGTGLGLSTVVGIVKSHGGFIHLYSEAGKGTTLRLYFPASDVAVAEEVPALEVEDLPRGNGELVLVVDDEAPVREIVERTLTRFGYRVALASHGAEAVSIFALRRREVAVVLTDMAMPIMDGPATIVALKAIEPDVKVIGSSGIAANGLVAKATGAGVHHFIPKPYGVETVLRTLRAVLESEPPVPSTRAPRW